MSHTDLAIRDHIQALDLTLFRLSVTAKPEQKLPIKIPLKPIKSVAQAIDKVKYLRFSRSKGYHIGLIPLAPQDFVVFKGSDDSLLNALQLAQSNVLYWNAATHEAWLHPDSSDCAALAQSLTDAGVAFQVLDVAMGQAALAGFQY